MKFFVKILKLGGRSLEYCNQCGNSLIEGSKFCNACGEKVSSLPNAPDSTQINRGVQLPVTSGVSEKQNMKLVRFLKSRWIISVITLIVLGLGTLYVYNRYFTLEGKAKSVVANYIKAIQNGDSTYEFTSSNVDDFYNVLDYKFIKASKMEVDTIVHVDRVKWDKDFLSGLTFTKTYEKEKEYFRALYEAKGVGGKVIAEDDDTMTIKTGSQHDKLMLLYDLQAINGAGESVLKRVYFTLENNDYGENMEITETVY
ncbi:MULTISPECIES: zinc ribbon domain-containing protein [Paenibacillus]|uniref:zinc ribbon domain-containing protein n=1 Tax=Paenibacillus TaxID=44249 RepID=UPI00096DA1BA|nr:zinc ribbon domain-containing protein [Paenibacillus odorifer]OMD80417.1 hypothetical protein BSK53_20375 [Paenibacillus odorifer]